MARNRTITIEAERMLSLRHRVENFNQPFTTLELDNWDIDSSLIIKYGDCMMPGETADEFFRRMNVKVKEV